MEDHTVLSAGYWRDIHCVFLKGEGGDLHLVRVYDEGMQFCGAIKAGRNRFVIASGFFDVAGELEIWDLDAGTAHHWSFPGGEKAASRFLWKGEIVVSACNRYAALCGGQSFRPQSVFLIDLEAPKLRQLQSVSWGQDALDMKSVDSLDAFEILARDHPRASMHRYDLSSEHAAIFDVDPKQWPKPPRTDWGAPTSSDASKMLCSMPVPLIKHALPYERRLLRVSPDMKPSGSGHFAQVVVVNPDTRP